MGNAAIIELAIGLIFVFSLLSILVTQINTIIVNILNLRANRLKEQLDSMLADPVVRAKILAHPLIRMVDTQAANALLTTPDSRITEEVARRMTENQQGQVDYIDRNIFVDVLIDVLTESTGQKLYEALEDVIDKMEPSIEKSRFRELLRRIRLSGTGLNELRDLIATLADPDTKRKMLAALNLVDTALDKLQAENSDLIPLLLGVRQIKDKHLETSLLAVLNTASSLNDARDKFAQWFDGGMERASAKYMREMQRISLVIGLLLAMLLNVDTLFLGRVLWEDNTLRTAVATAANTYGPEIITEFENQPELVPEDTTLETVSGSVQEARSTLEMLLALRLPIGWTFQPVTDTDQTLVLNNDRLDSRNLWQFSPANNPDSWLSLWVMKLIGLALTTVALAQGAPFWFDLLRKITQRDSST